VASIIGSATPAMTSTAVPLEPGLERNIDVISQHVARGGAAPGFTCAEECSRWWNAEHGPIPSWLSPETLHLELRTLRSRVGVLPLLRTMQPLDLAPVPSQFSWKVGQGAEAKVLHFELPGSGPATPSHPQYIADDYPYSLLWHGGGAIYSPPAPQDAPPGWYVTRGIWAFKSNEPPDRCSVGGREILRVDGRESARWRSREPRGGGHQICVTPCRCPGVSTRWALLPGVLGVLKHPRLPGGACEASRGDHADS